MARSKSSQKWLKKHFSDPYVKSAQREGYRSRACYKLLEIQEKYKIFHPGMVVLDLGAAPGGWSQLAREWVGEQGEVIALDILSMEPLPDVHFIQGDFTEDAVLQTLLDYLKGRKVDWVISDMAPNLSGTKAIDQPRSMLLCELALDVARDVLCPGGGLLMKLFEGAGSEALRKDLRKSFKQTNSVKPDASRSRSREVYVLARDYQ